MRHITNFLLNTEERARKFFINMPFLHAFLAGIGVIIFWRGAWELFDNLDVSPISSIIIGALILGGVGVFIQTFLGNTLIIKNVTREEKKEEKDIREVEAKISEEEITLKQLSDKIDALSEKLNK